MNYIKEVRDGSKDSHCYGQLTGYLDAALGEIHLRKVEEERIDEDGHQAGSQEKRIPPVQGLARGIQVAPALLLANLIVVDLGGGFEHQGLA